MVAIIEHLPVKCGVGLPSRLDSFAAERDRPPLLEEVHAVVAIIQHLPVKCGVGLPLRLDAFAAEREWRRC